METFRDTGQKSLCLVDLTLQNVDLEIHHRKEQSVCIDVKVLIYQVKSVLFAIVAENVLLFVSVAQLHHLASDQVADATS